MKSFFLPAMSAILPTGTKSIVEANRNVVRTQLDVEAFIAKSLAMAGTATPTDDSEEVVRNEERETIKRTIRFESIKPFQAALLS